MTDSVFPHLTKSISDFVYDEEGNIPRNRVLTVGAMLLLLSLAFADEAYAKHSSHSSHRSHSSHSSGGGGGHVSHVSHSSHASHSSGSTHSSHGSSSAAVPQVVAPTHGNDPVPVHNSHNNAAPSLSELNAIRVPDSTGSIDLAGKLGFVSLGQISPPATTSVVVDANDNISSGGGGQAE